MSQTRQFCTFWVADRFFGVDVRHVQEVLRRQTTTRVPLARSVVRGLLNLRGQLLTVIDMRARLGLAPNETDTESMNVIVRTDEGAASLVVDAIGDVVEADMTAMAPLPATMSEHAREVVVGVYPTKRELMLVLDTEKTIFQIAAAVPTT